MIGPVCVKVPKKKSCESCEFLISKEMGGTRIFPKKWTVHYCRHIDIDNGGVAFIGKKQRPWTPTWCPVKVMVEGD